MKKTMLGVLAIIMILGSLRAFAMEADYELTEGKINAAQISKMECMIDEMDTFKEEANSSYQMNDNSIGKITKLQQDSASTLSEVTAGATAAQIDSAVAEIRKNHKNSCEVAYKSKEVCSAAIAKSVCH